MTFGDASAMHAFRSCGGVSTREGSILLGSERQRGIMAGRHSPHQGASEKVQLKSSWSDPKTAQKRCGVTANPCFWNPKVLGPTLSLLHGLLWPGFAPTRRLGGWEDGVLGCDAWREAGAVYTRNK